LPSSLPLTINFSTPTTTNILQKQIRFLNFDVLLPDGPKAARTKFFDVFWWPLKHRTGLVVLKSHNLSQQQTTKQHQQQQHHHHHQQYQQTNKTNNINKYRLELSFDADSSSEPRASSATDVTSPKCDAMPATHRPDTTSHICVLGGLCETERERERERSIFCVDTLIEQSFEPLTTRLPNGLNIVQETDELCPKKTSKNNEQQLIKTRANKTPKNTLQKPPLKTRCVVPVATLHRRTVLS
jgi:hypothetical protein